MICVQKYLSAESSVRHIGRVVRGSVAGVVGFALGLRVEGLTRLVIHFVALRRCWEVAGPLAIHYPVTAGFPGRGMA
jgi:hypothetical protein